MSYSKTLLRKGKNLSGSLNAYLYGPEIHCENIWPGIGKLYKDIKINSVLLNCRIEPMELSDWLVAGIGHRKVNKRKRTERKYAGVLGRKHHILNILFHLCLGVQIIKQKRVYSVCAVLRAGGGQAGDRVRAMR